MKKAELDIIQPNTFRWHPHSHLLTHVCSLSTSDKNAQQTLCTDINGTVYIADVDCERTLHCLKQVLTNRQEFCVHPPHYEPKPSTSSNEPYLTERDTTVPFFDENSAFFQCLSSGTNGEPKRIIRTHQSWINSFAINAQIASINDTDSYAIIGRLSHSLALYAALEATHLGADLHALTDLRADRQLNAMASLHSSILYATPTQLRLLCKHANDINCTDLSVRHIFCGGGKLDQATAHCVKKLFDGAIVREFYGASETSFISMSDENTPVGSVGRPYPGVEIVIRKSVDDATGQAMSGDHYSRIDHGDGDGDGDGDQFTVGEVWVKSPYVFFAYADKDAQAARWSNGYVGVGEMGYINDQGYLFLVGRASRRVNISDTVVYPEQIETALLEHTAVSHCVVIPIKDKQRGYVLMGVVEAPNSAKLKQTLLVYLRQRVGALKAPRDILFVSEMPLLASGKPDLAAVNLLLKQHYPPS